MLRPASISTLRMAGLAALALIFTPNLNLNPAHATARSSSIVIDANTGAVLQQSQADEYRYPASVTKVMTLYLLFEEMERGRFNFNSRLHVSGYASKQAPSKLGVRAGQDIAVKDAILALVTRSANDVAVVIAENIAGSQSAFASMMTRKARQIGMTRTTFKNASGLPDLGQKTTARDLAMLGRALYERFPGYSKFFSTRAFNYKGRQIRGHNRLLGRVRGVDGIKTGYTRLSGFNLLTSARVDGRHVVAVVMGGNTGAQRDNQMARLVATYLPRASRKKIIDKQLIARIYNNSTMPVAVASNNVKKRKSEETFAQAATSVEIAAAGMPLGLAPVPPLRGSRLADIVGPAIAAADNNDAEEDIAEEDIASTERGDGLKWSVGAQSLETDKEVATASVLPTVPAAIQQNGQPAGYNGYNAPLDEETATTASNDTLTDADKELAVQEPAEAEAEQATLPSQSGWVVQIAASPSERGALKMLTEAKDKLKARLAHAQPFTERVTKGSATLYRARFGGFEKREMAETACAALKSKSYNCLTVRL